MPEVPPAFDYDAQRKRLATTSGKARPGLSESARSKVRKPRRQPIRQTRFFYPLMEQYCVRFGSSGPQAGGSGRILTGARKVRAGVFKYPWIWVGFLFAAGYLVAELDGLGPGPGQIIGPATLIYLAGLVYWAVRVYWLHAVLRTFDPSYPIAPGEAAGWNLMPLFNLYWIVHWPSVLADYVNRWSSTRMLRGPYLGLLLLCAILSGRFIGGTVGLVAVFAVTLYIGSMVRRLVETASAPEPREPAGNL